MSRLTRISPIYTPIVTCSPVTCHAHLASTVVLGHSFSCHPTVHAPALLADRDLSDIINELAPELSCRIAMLAFRISKLERILVAVPHWRCCSSSPRPPCGRDRHCNPNSAMSLLSNNSRLASGLIMQELMGNRIALYGSSIKMSSPCPLALASCGPS
jgi:hypothetical protein